MKQYAIAQITDPVAVTTKLSSMGLQYVKGMIFVSIPELGFESDNLIPCRYGMSIPWLKVKPQTSLWVEPTQGHTERWIYTGFADADPDSFSSTVSFQLKFSETTLIQVKADGTLELLSGALPSQKMVLGETLQTQINALKSDLSSAITSLNALVTAYNSHVHPGVTSGPGATGSVASGASPASAVTADFSSILSGKVKNN